MKTLKDHVAGQARFQKFFDGDFWYVTDSGFEFPVPHEEIGNGKMLRDEKAITFMRWIRQWMKVSQGETV